MRKRPILDLLALRYPEYGRDKLAAFLACRNVLVDGVVCGDPKMKVDVQSSISLSFEKYVSRGGFKLEEGLRRFSLDVRGKVILDAGSSTGGFTDCLLQQGARLVHAVDVGTNQLDWKLRNDSRVVVHEKQNIMTMQMGQLDPLPEAAVCDLSFRSIAGAASHILSLSQDHWLVSLIKPQFEVPKGLSGFDGVVRDGTLLLSVMENVFHQLEADGVFVSDVALSPIKGHKGNTEFLALLTHSPGLDLEEYLRRCRQFLSLNQ